MRECHRCLLQWTHEGEGAKREKVERVGHPLKNEEKRESGKVKATSHTSTYHPTLPSLHFILHDPVMHAEEKSTMHHCHAHATTMDCLRMP